MTRTSKIDLQLCTVNAVNVPERFFCSKKKDTEDPSQEDLDDKKVPKSLTSKYELFEETKQPVIYDYHEELYGVRWDEKHELKDAETENGFYLYRERKSHKKKSLEELSLKRGITGVFDVEDLVAALKSEQLADLCVIKVPPSANYCDYLVLVTAKNHRHLNKIIEFIRKLYKARRRDNDPHLTYTVGQPIGRHTIKSSWQVLDFGNIVLHMFLPGVREVYDLESLWSVGPEFDEKTVRPVYDEVTDILQKHVSFMESLVPDDDISANKS